MGQEEYHVVFRLEIPAAFKYLNVVSNSLTAILEQVKEIPERENLTYNVTLAVHEICTNIIEHAYSGQNDKMIKIKIDLNEQASLLVVDLHDTGQPFDLAATPDPDLDDAPIRGYGLFLVRQLMDEVTYAPGNNENHWRLKKELL